MKLQRFIGNFDLGSSRIISEDSKLINQIQKVFRLASGDQVILCNGKGAETVATINFISKKEVSFSLSGQTNEHIVKLRTTRLFQSILKKENFEYLVQKATECGVSEIVPIITERTVKLALNHERTQIIAKEAAEQSGRTVVPIVTTTATFKEALRRADSAIKIILDPTSSIPLQQLLLNSGSVDILVGPEGGFAPQEITDAEAAGFVRASLGELVLRGETAGLIATYIAAHASEK